MQLAVLPSFSQGQRLRFLVMFLAASLSGMEVARAASVPAGCATIHHAAQTSATGVTLDHVTVTAGGASLQASRQTLSGPDNGSAQDLADAASVVLLSALVGRHETACSNWLENEGRLAEQQLEAGRKLAVAWKNVNVRRNTLNIRSDTAQLALATTGTNATATLSLSGVTTAGVDAPSLLPSDARANFSLPVSELAALMASTGGKAKQLPAVHVTINSLTAQRDTVTLSGNGRATLTGEHDSASASGHLEIQDISGLIDRARQDSQMKVAAALILARVVSHRSGNVNTWDTTWEGGVLTVNGVPLPLH
ncbi:hypothetical protein [Acetobacter estunensis]|uniref:hypothetical protein n=1 Tax=Acetobacter estunensis TaxID=104097 RepID=UPI0020C46288|nr:hypothetical protein [Acetobacter estunensis]